MDRAKKLEVTFEFFLFGIIFGVIEDIVAVKIISGDKITWQVVGIVVLIAIPFAIIGEILEDNIDFSKFMRRFVSEDSKQNSEQNK